MTLWYCRKRVFIANFSLKVLKVKNCDLSQKVTYEVNTRRGPVTIMDRLVVNTYKRVVPNWCFAEIGKVFFKILK